MSSLREQIEREKEAFERSAGMQRAVKALPKPEPETGKQTELFGDRSNAWESLDFSDRQNWRELRVTQKQIGYLGRLTRTMRNIAQNKGWLEVVDVIDEIKRPTKRGKASDLIDCFQNLTKTWAEAGLAKEDVLDMIENARNK